MYYIVIPFCLAAAIAFGCYLSLKTFKSIPDEHK